MKSGLYILLTSAISALALSQTASAADKLVKASIYKAPIVAPAYNWTGLYVGGNVGGAWSGIMLTDNNAGASLNPGGTGFIGGAQAGYNLQAGSFLYGIEGDFDGSTFSSKTPPILTPLGLIEASAHKKWMTTLAARVGITSDRWLFYSKIGGGWTQGSAALNVVNGGEIWGASHTDSGWLLGAGIEYAFAHNWTGKLEYDYMGLSNATVSTPPVVECEPRHSNAESRTQLPVWQPHFERRPSFSTPAT
jgi:opacity protein-like surface antigen